MAAWSCPRHRPDSGSAWLHIPSRHSWTVIMNTSVLTSTCSLLSMTSVTSCLRRGCALEMFFNGLTLDDLERWKPVMDIYNFHTRIIERHLALSLKKTNAYAFFSQEHSSDQSVRWPAMFSLITWPHLRVHQKSIIKQISFMTSFSRVESSLQWKTFDVLRTGKGLNWNVIWNAQNCKPDDSCYVKDQ